MRPGRRTVVVGRNDPTARAAVTKDLPPRLACSRAMNCSGAAPMTTAAGPATGTGLTSPACRLPGLSQTAGRLTRRGQHSHRRMAWQRRPNGTPGQGARVPPTGRTTARCPRLLGQMPLPLHGRFPVWRRVLRSAAARCGSRRLAQTGARSSTRPRAASGPGTPSRSGSRLRAQTTLRPCSRTRAPSRLGQPGRRCPRRGPCRRLHPSRDRTSVRYSAPSSPSPISPECGRRLRCCPITLRPRLGRGPVRQTDPFPHPPRLASRLLAVAATTRTRTRCR
jgi:hypothetical protein